MRMSKMRRRWRRRWRRSRRVWKRMMRRRMRCMGKYGGVLMDEEGEGSGMEEG